MTSTRGSASSCALRAFFISAPALSAPIATTYRSLAMVHSPDCRYAERDTLRVVDARMSSVDVQIRSHRTRCFACSFEVTLAQEDFSCPSLLFEPGPESVQDMVDRR